MISRDHSRFGKIRFAPWLNAMHMYVFFSIYSHVYRHPFLFGDIISASPYFFFVLLIYYITTGHSWVKLMSLDQMLFTKYPQFNQKKENQIDNPPWSFHLLPPTSTQKIWQKSKESGYASSNISTVVRSRSINPLLLTRTAHNPLPKRNLCGVNFTLPSGRVGSIRVGPYQAWTRLPNH